MRLSIFKQDSHMLVAEGTPSRVPVNCLIPAATAAK